MFGDSLVPSTSHSIDWRHNGPSILLDLVTLTVTAREIRNLRTVGLYRVVDVDEDQEDGDQQGHPARDDLRVDQETEINAVTISLYWDGSDGLTRLIQDTTTNSPEGR